MLTKQKIPQNILEKILNQFDLGKIRKVEPLSTSGNITYIVKSLKGSYLLRLSPSGPRWRSRKEIEAELELISRLLKDNFPAPQPVKTKNGQSIIFWEGHFGYLRKFTKAKEILNPDLKQIEKFGRLVGKFHNLIENYKTKNKRSHIWDLKTTKNNFKEDKKIITKSNFPYKKEFLKSFEKEISKISFPKNLPKGIIHEDLGKRHVLWRKNNIAAVIDFDRSYYGELVLDLGQACRGWCFTDNWQKWSNKNFKALISGYQKERKLTNLEKNSLFNAIKFGVLERGLSFALRFKTTQDKEDADYALYSVVENGLLGMLEKNRRSIEKFLKIA